ncbi:MAG TPA: HYR domain-containing protein [Saprospiraceae bacterium]|nr:HYR domain-containing protein [Saprospiraceae bacterium]
MSFLQKKLDIFRAIRFGSKRFTMFVAALLFLLTVPMIGISQDRYVATTGVDVGNCSLPGSPCLTIQYAIDQAVSGDNVNVSSGTYNENVNINVPVNLLGTDAIVQGSDGMPGTFHLPNGINGVTINGFTIIGYDSASPGLERAAIYLTGNHNNITITNNTITANGEAGLLDEVSGANTNFILQNNTFNGQTFVGSTPGDCGFANQFTAPNVPRQLVVFQGATDSNIQFLDNIISGVAGGTTLLAPCDVNGQGNTLVTIDATNVTITGNTFSGTTARFATMLRTRGTGVSISGNNFDGSNLIGPAGYFFFDADALTGGTPSTPVGVVQGNTFSPQVTIVVDVSGNVSFFVCPEINLTTNINGNIVVTDFDGINDSTSFSVCNTPTNITFNTFSIDVASPSFKVLQFVETDNVTVPFCNNCVAIPSAFNGTTGTASLVNNTLDGTLTMKFVGFIDLNSNNILDIGECPIDTVVYSVTVQSAPSGVTCPADSTICNNIDTLNLAGLATPVGGVFSGPGVAGNDFVVANAGLGTHALTYVFTDIAGCPNTCTFDITVYDFPVAPQLEANPDQAVVCLNDILTVDITSPGSAGSGVCVDEYRYSSDDGTNWSNWEDTIPVFQAVLGTNIIQSRRICDLGNCPSDVFEVSWDVNEPITSATIDVIPSGNVCLGATGIQYTANVVGGTGTISYAWCAYNTGNGSGTCFGSFTPGGNNAVQTRNWTSTTGPKSVGVTVSQEGCPDVTALYSFVVTADPVAPTLNASTPTSGTEVCEGSLVSATFNAGSGGAGTCIDEFRYSIDNGANYLPYVAGTEIEVGTQTVIIQARRVCDGLGCDGSGETYAAVARWVVNLNPTVNILPVPAEVCQSTDLLLNGNPSGGSGVYVSHEWSSIGATYLDNDAIQEPTFNSNVSGLFELVYTVTDDNGCIASGSTEVEVFANPTVTITPDPAIVCPATDLVLNAGAAGGLSPYTYAWSGVGAASLDATDVASPVFNNGAEGDYELIVNVTDANGCLAQDTIEVVVEDVTLPLISCPSDISVSAGVDSCSTIVFFQVTATDNCPTLITIESLGLLESGSEFPVGINTLTYQASDLAGNTATCTFEVVVTDDQAPEITCPANIVINLDPLECEGFPIFADAVATDNCPDVVVSLVTPLGSGDAFPIGVTEVTYEAVDTSGNVSQCTFTVTVNDYVNPSLACKPVQLSLDENCEGVLDPTIVLSGWAGAGDPPAVLLGCLDYYEINIIGSNGELLGDTADRSLLGKTLDYTIRHTVSGFNCWNTVTIEDKIAPTITCTDITVSCLADITNLGLPTVTDNCHATAVLVNEVHAVLQCDLIYAGTVTRTWKAVDDFGNESGVCTSTVYIRRPDLINVVGPASDTLVCNSGYDVDDKGLNYPSPFETGVPTYRNVPIYPLEFFNMTFCNATIDYTDQLILDTPCKKRILRTWTITEWWCSTAISYNLPPQFINIIDNVAPVIPDVADITVTTQTRSCDAAVQLPNLSITDNCTDVYNIFVNARLNGQAVGYFGGNGGFMTLAVGVNEITYTAIDECGNTTKMSYFITVKDDTDPVAICDQHTTVSIKDNGYTEVTASAVDDGSFDECGAVTLKLQRMEDPCNFGQDTLWHDKVGFCCADANTTRMVQLLVTDAGGNTNVCMVSVQVQDKVIPTIECPANLTIEDCLFTFDPSPAGADAAFGAAIITDNCPANNVILQTIKDNRSQCGIGKVERTFTVSGAGITYGTCAQTITFENNDPFLGSSIDWPKDYVALGQCDFDGLEPETLPDSSSFPIFTEDACDLVGMRHDDVVFPFTTNGACYKIIRTWTVIDWCQKNSDGTNVTWTYEQEIKVVDNVAPVLTVSDTTVIFETLACSTGLVTLSASALDCTPAVDLVWNYTITQGANVVATGNTRTVVDSFEVGEYTISFTVEDRCGNLSADAFDFEVVTLKAPTATCHFGLSAPLVLMDTDGNGSGDTPMLMLTPEFFNNKSSHTCGYDLSLSFSADLMDTLVVFDCDGLGEQDIQMWVTDQNGNTSFCSTYVIVQDNDNLCPSPLVGVISGKTIKENNDVIQDVTLELKGGEAGPVNTNFDGNYAFIPMNTGGDYRVIPSKDGDDANGISTLDLVMIQRHILGIEKLKSPYKLIAADANNSGKITAADLIDIRKLILGVNPSFVNNTSWRFVDAGFVFPDPTDPWMTTFGEEYNIDNLSGSMNIDFIGIKVGDVNDNAKGRNINSGDISSRSNQLYQIADRQVSKGDIIDIPVMVNNIHTIYGMQMSLASNDMIIRDIKEGALQINGEDFVSNGSNMAMSLSIANGKLVTDGDVLFTLEVEVLRSGKLSDFLQIDNKVKPEVYVNSDMETKAFNIDWRTSSEGNFALIGNHPNPWNSNTSVTFEIPADGMVTFKVKDYTGRKVISQVDQFTAGINTISLQRSDLIQSGVYIYEIKFGDKVLHGKMIMID